MKDEKSVFNQAEKTYEWVKQKRDLMPSVDEVALDVTSWAMQQEGYFSTHGKYQLEYVYLLAMLHEIKQLRDKMSITTT